MRNHMKRFWFKTFPTNRLKSQHIRFVKIDGFIRRYDGTRYLVLFGPKKYDEIYDRFRHAVGLISGIIFFFSRDDAKIKTNSDNSLPLEETLTLHNVVMHIKSKSIKIKIVTTIINIYKNVSIN